MLLKQIMGSQDQLFIDEYYMPKLIAMAKNHVDAINTLNNYYRDKAGSNQDADIKLKSMNEKLMKDNKELHQQKADHNQQISDLNKTMFE